MLLFISTLDADYFEWSTKRMEAVHQECNRKGSKLCKINNPLFLSRGYECVKERMTVMKCSFHICRDVHTKIEETLCMQHAKLFVGSLATLADCPVIFDMPTKRSEQEKCKSESDPYDRKQCYRDASAAVSKFYNSLLFGGNTVAAVSRTCHFYSEEHEKNCIQYVPWYMIVAEIWISSINHFPSRSDVLHECMEVSPGDNPDLSTACITDTIHFVSRFYEAVHMKMKIEDAIEYVCHIEDLHKKHCTYLPFYLVAAYRCINDGNCHESYDEHELKILKIREKQPDGIKESPFIGHPHLQYPDCSKLIPEFRY